MRKYSKWILIIALIAAAVVLRETTGIISREEYKPDRGKQALVVFGEKADAAAPDTTWSKEEREGTGETAALPLEVPGEATAEGDINGDGRPDLIVLRGDGLTVFIKNPDGRDFEEGVDYAVGRSPSSLTLADYDGDGDLDVLAGTAPTETENGAARTDTALLRGNGDGTLREVEYLTAGGDKEDLSAADFDSDGTLDLAYVPRSGGGEFSWGFWSVIPPLLTLFLAFWTRQVLLALFLGIMAGGIVSANYNVVEAYLIPALGSSGYAQILLVYLWCLGGLIGLWTKTGGAELFARWAASHLVRGRRSAKFFAFLMGLIFHQGGTISTILAGTTVRPVCDEEKVSHEELSYIIDSTASPVATIIPLNIWPTYTGGLIVGTAGFLTTMGAAVSFYWSAIPFNFYAIIAILFTFLTSVEKMPWYGKRMKLAMERVKATGKLDSDEAAPLTSRELSTVDVAEGYRPGLEDFLIPLGTLIAIAGTGIALTGKPAVNEAFFTSVVMAILVALFKGMPVRTAVDAFIEGCKGVTIGAIIIGLAVTLKEVSMSLGTAYYIVEHLSTIMPAIVLPAAFLGITMFISFSTGTSLGTYAVVLPIAMPLAAAVAENAALGNPELYLTLCFAAVIGGSVYGDNCSPISDTTILSSVATGADLMDHTYSQLPMATMAAFLAGVCYVVAAMFTL
jgi:Na+/H+ antiporter NhaC